MALIIPCTPADYDNLCELLRRLTEHSTSQPDRIVVGMSESDALDSEQKQNLEQLLSNWSQKALQSGMREASHFCTYTAHKALVGANRNRAIDQCKNCDLIVCHDADDDIHPQKIAMLRHWFTKRSDVLLINHWAMAYGYNWPRYSDFAAVPIDDCDAVHRIGLKFYTLGPLARGHSAFRRTVHDAIRFRDNYAYGEDTCFVREVQEQFGARCIVLRAPLAKYDLFEEMPKALLAQRSNWSAKEEPRGLVANRTKESWEARV